jgi:hypothetical protein
VLNGELSLGGEGAYGWRKLIRLLGSGSENATFSDPRGMAADDR